MTENKKQITAAILGCGPNDGAKEFDRGRAAYEARDLKKAEKLLEKSLACAPNDVDRLLLLARTELDLGELALDVALVLHLHLCGAANCRGERGSLGVKGCYRLVSKLGAAEKLRKLRSRGDLG